MVDKSVITPLYEQVADELRKEIVCGLYGESGSIGTQNELEERFNVSLITIRKAVQILEKEGLVEIRQGKGTFIRSTNLVDHLQNLTGITNMMSDMNVKPEVSVTVIEIRDTPEWFPKDVRKAYGRKALFIQRIVSMNNIPFANTDMYLPAKYKDSFTKREVEESTVYKIYQNKLSIKLGKGRQVIRACGAHGDVAKNLKLSDNCPVLQIERKAYDDHENLIEFMILSYEASKYSFEVELELNK